MTSSDIAIRVENLGKCYRIGRTRQRHDTLRDALMGAFSRKGARDLRKRGNVPTASDLLWALKDVSFEVKRGEVVGIIGRNGAGKSTLLKILSRITEPTEGRAELYGRVGSLLEVGTGFHPELTGRENVYLSGAILGMRRAEIDRKFGEIVAFAEVEKFIDTPFKHYSSGMKVRLGFAVAAHLEPEILLVDEVLAVGDAAFQKKCLGKMGEVAGEGRTVLFVSHNMGAVKTLCACALMLDSGLIMAVGASDTVVTRYLNAAMQNSGGTVALDENLSDATFVRISVLDADHSCAEVIEVTSDFFIRFEYRVRCPVSGLEVSFSMFDSNGAKIFRSGTSSNGDSLQNEYGPGLYLAMVRIPARFLAPGTYSITAGLHRPNIRLHDQRSHILSFSIVETGSTSYYYAERDIGSVLVDLDWQVTKSS